MSMFGAFRYREYRLFWLGFSVSSTCTWMEVLGHGWLAVVLALRADAPHLAPLYVGVVGLARALPGLGLGLIAGAVADRGDRRRLLILTQLAGCFLALVLGALVATGTVTIAALVLIAALRSCVYSFDMPSRQAIVPRLVERSDLMSAIGLHQASFNGPQVIGPALGGLIIGGGDGVAQLLFVVAAAYLAVGAILAAMAPVPPLANATASSLMRSVLDGLAYIGSDTVIRWSVALAATFALFARPFVFLLPAFVASTLGGGAGELSAIMAVTGAGAFCGALIVAALGAVGRQGLLQLVASGAVGVGLMVFATQRDLLAASALAFVIGLGTIVFQGVCSNVLQLTAPDRMLGRVMSVFALLYMGVLPLGQFVLGAAGTAAGMDAVLVTAGAATLGSALYAGARLAPIRSWQARSVVMRSDARATPSVLTSSGDG